MSPRLSHDAFYGTTEQGGIKNGACFLFTAGNGAVYRIRVRGK